MPATRLNLLERPAGRGVLFTLLYLSEGAPIGFVWLALPTLLRGAGAPVEKVTALVAMLVLPWVFKFLWAPLVDAWRGPRWGFRAWIMSAQLLMGLALLPLIWLDPAEHFGLWSVLLLLHAFSAATQDVAIDALAINSVPAQQRGTINGFMQAGMLLGRSLFGGGTLLVAGHLGLPWVIAGLIACIWSSLVLLGFVREPIPARQTRSRSADFCQRLQAVLRKRTTWVGLAFALVGAAAFESTGLLAGPYLLDRGIAQSTIGWFLGLPVVAAMMIGGLAGGRISDRIGRHRAVGVFLIGFVSFIVALGLADQFRIDSNALVFGLLTGMYLFVGLFTAASYALFMDLTDPKLGGTQFSAFMAATNGCESWTAWAGGRLVAGPGYGASFLVMSGVSLLSLPLLVWLAKIKPPPAAGPDKTRADTLASPRARN